MRGNASANTPRGRKGGSVIYLIAFLLLAAAIAFAAVKVFSVINSMARSAVTTVDDRLGVEKALANIPGSHSATKVKRPAPCSGMNKVDLGWYDKAYHESAAVSLPRGCAVMVEVHPDPAARISFRFDNGPKNDLGVATKSKSWLIKAGDVPPSIDTAKDYVFWFWDPKGQSHLVLRADRL
ncbi:MAG: hypothetical protein LiPW15_744 [Parcubacteria group bacterium LiPW_15]|nr:MAG: hypothetical protein LiPW15_744 [Parcubacteria group bacterium LiPW_15]